MEEVSSSVLMSHLLSAHPPSGWCRVFMGPHFGHREEWVLGLQEGCRRCGHASAPFTLGLNS